MTVALQIEQKYWNALIFFTVLMCIGNNEAMVQSWENFDKNHA